MSADLQSKDHRDLLDVIDRLRSRGIGDYVPLPEIIVCGEQSSGKSSVLEAISGVPFPTKDGLCTRFATELVLRRHRKSGVKVSIRPGPERTVEEKAQLSSFNVKQPDSILGNFDQVIESAKQCMGVSETKAFSSDVLRVELYGPTQPHLTMVDLPGLFRAGTSDQSVEDSKVVREIIRGYMDRPRSIILAVISASSEYVSQEVTTLAREVDPKGERTLGRITKPDKLDVGSDTENFYLRLAQNKEVVFRLGWHVLKNRDHKMKNATSEERNKAEDDFFSTSNWTLIDSNQVGVKTLRPRLSEVLKGEILHQLPSLVKDVEQNIAECQSYLQHLGVARNNLKEQRRYLMLVSQKFSTLMRAAINGVYNDPFFGDLKTEAGCEKRLRAVVQNRLEKFSDKMEIEGRARLIVEELPESVSSRHIFRSNYLIEVENLMRKSKGCELQGTFNPMIVVDLFTEQCEPWNDICIQTKDIIVQAVYRVMQFVIEQITVKETTDGILQMIIKRFEICEKKVNNKLTELLRPHSYGHPITYNHDLTVHVQEAQTDRRNRKLQDFFDTRILYDRPDKTARDKVLEILSLLMEEDPIEMQRYASELALDYMEAYYKV
jgi:hypothetical protein